MAYTDSYMCESWQQTDIIDSHMPIGTNGPLMAYFDKSTNGLSQQLFT